MARHRRRKARARPRPDKDRRRKKGFDMHKFLTAAAFCAALMTLSPAPASAQMDIFEAQQEAVEKPGGGMRTVTPINKCLEQLPEADAIEIRGNYLKPYQECQRRLQNLKRKGEDGKAADKSEARKKAARKDSEDDEDDSAAAAPAPAPAEDARNFVRVRKDDSPRRPANFSDSAPARDTEPAEKGNRHGMYNR